MRRFTPKRAEHNRMVKPIRDEYRECHPRCEVPWCEERATELHEISRGPARAKSLNVEAALLHLCRECHWKMGALPVAAQLALKKLAGSGYDRQRVNELRGRQPDAITEQEVDEWIHKFDMASNPAKGQAQGESTGRWVGRLT